MGTQSSCPHLGPTHGKGRPGQTWLGPSQVHSESTDCSWGSVRFLNSDKVGGKTGEVTSPVIAWTVQLVAGSQAGHRARATAGCHFSTNDGRAFVESQWDSPLWRADGYFDCDVYSNTVRAVKMDAGHREKRAGRNETEQRRPHCNLSIQVSCISISCYSDSNDEI